MAAVVMTAVVAIGAGSYLLVTRATTHLAASADTAKASPAATQDAGVAVAAKQYETIAARSNAQQAALAPAANKLLANGTLDIGQAKLFFTATAAITRQFDAGLRTIEFPARLSGDVDNVLALDAQEVALYDKVVHGSSCADYCSAYEQHLGVDKQLGIAVRQLRNDLGLLPPS